MAPCAWCEFLTYGIREPNEMVVIQSSVLEWFVSRLAWSRARGPSVTGLCLPG